MAVVTASSTYRESSGSLTLYTFVLDSVNTSVFASGLPNVISYYAATDSVASYSIVPVATGTTGNTFNIVTSATTGLRLNVLART